MSQTEIHKGKIIPKPRLENETDIVYLNRVLNKELQEIEEDGISEYFYEHELYEKYLYRDEVIYKIESEELDEEELYTFKKKKNGTIEFQTNFYKGTCLAEVLEEIIDAAKR